MARYEDDIDRLKKSDEAKRLVQKNPFAYCQVMFVDERHYKMSPERKNLPPKEIKIPCRYCGKREVTTVTRGIGTEKVKDYLCGLCSEQVAKVGHRKVIVD